LDYLEGISITWPFNVLFPVQNMSNAAALRATEMGRGLYCSLA